MHQTPRKPSTRITAILMAVILVLGSLLAMTRLKTGGLRCEPLNDGANTAEIIVDDKVAKFEKREIQRAECDCSGAKKTEMSDPKLPPVDDKALSIVWAMMPKCMIDLYERTPLPDGFSSRIRNNLPGGLDAVFMMHYTPLEARRKFQERHLQPHFNDSIVWITAFDRENLTLRDYKCCMSPSASGDKVSRHRGVGDILVDAGCRDAKLTPRGVPQLTNKKLDLDIDIGELQALLRLLPAIEVRFEDGDVPRGRQRVQR